MRSWKIIFQDSLAMKWCNMFMVVSSDFHGIFTNLSFIVHSMVDISWPSLLNSPRRNLLHHHQLSGWMNPLRHHLYSRHRHCHHLLQGIWKKNFCKVLVMLNVCVDVYDNDHAWLACWNFVTLNEVVQVIVFSYTCWKTQMVHE